MMVRLRCTQGASDKEYTIAVQGTNVVASHGRYGSKLRSNVHPQLSEDDAKQFALTLETQKRAKGYYVVGRDDDADAPTSQEWTIFATGCARAPNERVKALIGPIAPNGNRETVLDVAQVRFRTGSDGSEELELAGSAVMSDVNGCATLVALAHAAGISVMDPSGESVDVPAFLRDRTRFSASAIALLQRSGAIAPTLAFGSFCTQPSQVSQWNGMF